MLLLPVSLYYYYYYNNNYIYSVKKNPLSVVSPQKSKCKPFQLKRDLKNNYI
jgi:hypothetical protein